MTFFFRYISYRKVIQTKVEGLNEKYIHITYKFSTVGHFWRKSGKV